MAAPGEDSSRSPLFLFGALCVLAGLVVGGWLFTERAFRDMPLEAVADHEANAVRVLRAFHAAGGSDPRAEPGGWFHSRGYRYELRKEAAGAGWCAYAWPDADSTLPEGRTFYVDQAGTILQAPPPAGRIRTVHPGNPAADGRTWTPVK